MAQPNSIYSDMRGDFGDLLIGENIYQDVDFINHADNLVISDITKAIEILTKQRTFIDDGEGALLYLSIKGQVLQSLENARELMSVYQGMCISYTAGTRPPSQDDMMHFLNKWRKKRPKL